MSRQSLAERIASAVMVELYTLGHSPKPLDLSDQEFEAIATKVQDLLDSTAEQVLGLLNGGETGALQKHKHHLRRRRDTGEPQERQRGVKR